MCLGLELVNRTIGAHKSGRLQECDDRAIDVCHELDGATTRSPCPALS